MTTITAALNRRSGEDRGSRTRNAAILTLCLLAAAGIAVLYYQYLYKPEADRLTELRSRIDTQTQAVRDAQNILLGRALILQRNAQQQLEHLEFMARFPAGYRNQPVLRDLRETAELSGLTLTDLSLKLEARTDPELRRITAEVQVSGTVNELYDYLQRLNGLTRFYAAGPFVLNVEGERRGAALLGTQLTLYSQYSTPAPPAILPDPGPAPSALLTTP